MITYLVNFTLCSALMLAAYHLLLKNKATYRFNRFYLLTSVMLALLVPLIVVRAAVPVLFGPLWLDTDGTARFSHTDEAIRAVSLAPQAAVDHVKFSLGQYTGAVLWLIYGLVSALLLWQFIKNLRAVFKGIRGNEALAYNGAWLVLIAHKQTPHTFLNYIFLNRNEYYNGQVDETILQHELTHARQRHSIDVLAIELLQVFCWFNPVLLLYGKAIRLNHEFLADEAVVEANYDVTGYQNLLVNKLGEVACTAVANGFNYSVTKKRLLMMTKKTSAAAAWVSGAALMPVLIIAYMLFCTKTDIGVGPGWPLIGDVYGPNRDLVRHNIEAAKVDAPQAVLDEFTLIERKYDLLKYPWNENLERMTPEDKARMIALYRQMSRNQQDRQTTRFCHLILPESLRAATRYELSQWSISPKSFRVYLNGNVIKNTDLHAYRDSDVLLLWATDSVGLMTRSRYISNRDFERSQVLTYFNHRR